MNPLQIIGLVVLIVSLTMGGILLAILLGGHRR